MTTITVLFLHKNSYEEDKAQIENEIILHGDDEYPISDFQVKYENHDTMLFADLMNSQHVDVCVAYDDMIDDLHFLLLEDIGEYQHFGEAIEELIDPERYFNMTVLTLDVVK